MRLQYQEYDIEDVFRYFVKGFEGAKGETIIKYSSFYDARKGRVMFELYVEDKPKE